MRVIVYGCCVNYGTIEKVSEIWMPRTLLEESQAITINWDCEKIL